MAFLFSEASIKKFQIILSVLLVFSLLSTAHADTCTTSQRADLATAGYKKAEIEKMCSGTSSGAPSQFHQHQVEAPKGYVSQGGLTWMPVTSSDTWVDANAYCDNTVINGLSRWRLPTKSELLSLFSSKAMNDNGWELGNTVSSMSGGAGYHYSIDLNVGTLMLYDDTYSAYLTCVR